MSEFSRALIENSGYERAGFAAGYDRYRPRPPGLLLELLARYARVERPALVVDLGCGTGLSTRAWSGRARRVTGVEPNPAMLAAAEAAPGVEYVQAFAQATGLPDCSRRHRHLLAVAALDGTGAGLCEAARLLRPGGVFAAYDYDWPPLVDPEVDQAYAAYQERRRLVREQRGIQRGGDRWAKDGHLERMRESGCFGWCREVVLHSVEDGDAERIGGFARSLGLPVAAGDDDELERDLGIDELEAVARRVLGDRTVPFLFGYRVRLGIKT